MEPRLEPEPGGRNGQQSTDPERYAKSDQQPITLHGGTSRRA